MILIEKNTKNDQSTYDLPHFFQDDEQYVDRQSVQMNFQQFHVLILSDFRRGVYSRNLLLLKTLLMHIKCMHRDKTRRIFDLMWNMAYSLN